jgi:hypothetical protein
MRERNEDLVEDKKPGWKGMTMCASSGFASSLLPSSSHSTTHQSRDCVNKSLNSTHVGKCKE